MTAPKLKTASFTVRATVAQSIAWKRHAEAEGAASVGSWIATSLDRYLDALKRAGKPLPLSWHRSRFTIRLEGGEAVSVKGHVSPPFFAYRGTAERYDRQSDHFSLIYQPTGRLIATLRSYAQCRALAADLSRVWVRWGGEEPAEEAGPVVERHRRESA